MEDTRNWKQKHRNQPTKPKPTRSRRSFGISVCLLSRSGNAVGFAEIDASKCSWDRIVDDCHLNGKNDSMIPHSAKEIEVCKQQQKREWKWSKLGWDSETNSSKPNQCELWIVVSAAMLKFSSFWSHWQNLFESRFDLFIYFNSFAHTLKWL